MFQWLQRLKRQRQSDEELERLRQLVAASPKAREQHYIFAHRFLPAVARQMGAVLVFLLANEDKRDDFLRSAWEDCGTGEVGDDLVAPDGLRASVAKAGEQLIAIVTLPTPQRITEAHFVAILSDLPPETDDEDADDPEDAREVLRLILRSMPVRYFTLEQGIPLGGRARTAFCEWTEGGAHLNMGDGPAPDETEFFRFLAAQNFPPVRASFNPKRTRPVQDGE